MDGYLYIMDCGDARKVGFSRNPKSRRATVAREWGCDVELVATFVPPGDARDAEAAAHKILSCHHVRAEWFSASVGECREALVVIGCSECSIPHIADQNPPVVFRFSPEELAELEAAKAKHGSYKAAIMAGIRQTLGADETDWPAELRRLASELEAK